MCIPVPLGSPLPTPSPPQLVRASSRKATPVLRGDHHLPHPTTCASANAAKGVESDQLFSAAKNIGVLPAPFTVGAFQGLTSGAAGCPFQARSAVCLPQCGPGWASPLLLLPSHLSHTHSPPPPLPRTEFPDNYGDKARLPPSLLVRQRRREKPLGMPWGEEAAWPIKGISWVPPWKREEGQLAFLGQCPSVRSPFSPGS